MSANYWQQPTATTVPGNIACALHARGLERVYLLRQAHARLSSQIARQTQTKRALDAKAGDIAEKALLRNGRRAFDLHSEEWADILHECFTDFEASVYQELISVAHQAFLACSRMMAKRARIERVMAAAETRRLA